jgi:hypothetical protein
MQGRGGDTHPLQPDAQRWGKQVQVAEHESILQTLNPKPFVITSLLHILAC